MKPFRLFPRDSLGSSSSASFGSDTFQRRQRWLLLPPPSAELRADQQDTDSLPPYDILDAILQRYVENDESTDAIVDAGFDRPVVERVMHMVDRNEYKRAQSPIGLKVTTRAFGWGRRMPIAAKYR